MRIIAMKNRQAEYRAMKILVEKDLVSREIIPLVEIIQESNAQDASGSEVAKWSNLLAGRRFFVDFFRCDLKLYGQVDLEKIPLVIELTNNIDRYLAKLLDLSKHNNVIPVVALKNGIDKLSPEAVAACIASLRAAGSFDGIAVRVDDIEGYEEVLQDSLGKKDFVLFDISEQPFNSKLMEYEELQMLDLMASTILLCSPRHRKVNNGSYVNGAHATLIDDTGAVLYADYGFDAYGDYGGLKDNLPGRGGGSRGCALALLFDNESGRYISYVCNDVAEGLKGYVTVVDSILDDWEMLNPDRECAALNLVSLKSREGKYGNWSTWITYVLMRTVQQLSTKD